MQKSLKGSNLIVGLTFDFASDIILYCDQLEENRKYNLAKQLFRSGTSIGANVKEAQNAESKPDFIHKFKIAAKETDETEYWLELICLRYDHVEARLLLEKLEIISKIINKIITTAKKEPANNKVTK